MSGMCIKYSRSITPRSLEGEDKRLHVDTTPSNYKQLEGLLVKVASFLSRFSVFVVL